MDSVEPFTLGDLQLVEKWLKEFGEVFVVVGFSRCASSPLNYFIRSTDDFRALVAEQRQSHPMPQYRWAVVSFDVYRGPAFPIRGDATEELADRACAAIPNGCDFWIVHPNGPPLSDLKVHNGGDSHEQLRHQIGEVAGMFVAIGSHPMDISDEKWDEMHPGSTVRRLFAPEETR